MQRPWQIEDFNSCCCRLILVEPSQLGFTMEMLPLLENPARSEALIPISTV